MNGMQMTSWSSISLHSLGNQKKSRRSLDYHSTLLPCTCSKPEAVTGSCETSCFVRIGLPVLKPKAPLHCVVPLHYLIVSSLAKLRSRRQLHWHPRPPACLIHDCRLDAHSSSCSFAATSRASPASRTSPRTQNVLRSQLNRVLRWEAQSYKFLGAGHPVRIEKS